MAQALGRVVDSSALDACGQPRGKHAIEIPAEWLGAEVLVAIPSRLVCARCDGGGCDGCHRRGGHRIEGDASVRSVRVRLPEAIEGRVVLRLVTPFGSAEGAVAQIHLETRIGAGASAGVVLIALPVFRDEPIATRNDAGKSLRCVRWIIAAITLVALLITLSTMR